MNVVRDKMTALGTAANNGHYECIEILKEAGAAVNITDPSLTPSLICAIRAEATGNVVRKTVEVLIKAGADVNAIFADTFGTTYA